MFGLRIFRLDHVCYRTCDRGHLLLHLLASLVAGDEEAAREIRPELAETTERLPRALMGGNGWGQGRKGVTPEFLT